MSLRYLSVCSGIEAASVAWEPLGWQPLALAEVAKFPRKVLAHRFPQVPLHGDFTALRDQPWIADADLLVGGTPCQAFSVAGLRGSLSDARGNLTLEFVRLADAIDDLRRDHGRESAWILWENVPGVLNTADNAFGALLGGLAGSDAAIEHAGGWPSAGVVAGPRRVVAWRTLDAQYYGVAQRRRRVFVLARGRAAPCGGWSAANALLPVADSRSRNPAPRRQAREGAPADAAACAGIGGAVAALTASGRGVARVGESRGQDPVVPIAFHPTQDPIHSTDGTTHALGCGSSGGQASVAVATPYAVRRLTPTECERLQGFKDGWTDITPGKTPDGPRYKALGNSMAVPVMAWIGKQIDKARNR